MTGTEFAIVIGAILTGMAGLITAVTTNRSAASKAQLEVLSKTIETVQRENERLLARVEHLEREVDERDGALAQVQEWAELLVAQVRKLGGDPVPMPDREATKPRRRVSPQ